MTLSRAVCLTTFLNILNIAYESSMLLLIFVGSSLELRLSANFQLSDVFVPVGYYNNLLINGCFDLVLGGFQTFWSLPQERSSVHGALCDFSHKN